MELLQERNEEETDNRNNNVEALLRIKIKTSIHILSLACQAPLVHGIFLARIPEWVASSFSSDLPKSGIEPGASALQADSLPNELPGKS